MIIALLLPILGTVYAFWRIWMILPFGGVWKAGVLGLLLLGWAALLFTFIGPLDSLPLNIASWVYQIGTSWLMILLYIVLTFGVIDLLRLCGVIPGSWVTANGIGSAVLLGLLTVIFIAGNMNYKYKRRQEWTIKSSKIKENPMKLVMMSDLHLGYHNRREELARWVALINKEKPDLVLIAGDIIDRSVRPLEEEKMVEEFHKINAPVFACWGNHEYYSGREYALKFYKEAGIHLLEDRYEKLNQITIVGRDDKTNSRRKPLTELMYNIDPDNFVILLDHQPYHLEEAQRVGVDLQLSGHTHRGQVWPISWIVDAMYEKSYGKYQKGNTLYYISSGMGIWGGKFRIGTISEYMVIHLIPNS